MNKLLKPSQRNIYLLFFPLGLRTIFTACSMAQYEIMPAPNYDHLVGKRFSESIYLGRLSFKVINTSPKVEELEERRPDGCILVFGVRKKDDIIEYWRIDSGIGSCPTRKAPLNR